MDDITSLLVDPENQSTQNQPVASKPSGSTDKQFKQIFNNGSSKPAPQISDLEKQIADNKSDPISDLLVDPPGTVHVDISGAGPGSLPSQSKSLQDEYPESTMPNMYRISGGYSQYLADMANAKAHNGSNESLWDKAGGALEAGASTILGGAMLPVATIAKAGREAFGGTSEQGNQVFDKLMNWTQPATDAGQRYAGNVNDAMGAVLPGLIPQAAELSNLGRGTPNRIVNAEQTGYLGDIASRAEPGLENAPPRAIQSAPQPAGMELPQGRVEPTMESNAAPLQSTMKGGGAASTAQNPVPRLTGQEDARGEFPQVKLSNTSGDVSPEEQHVRSQVVSEVMGPDATARTGVITGNGQTLRSEHTLARNPDQSPAANVMSKQIAKEQQALSSYAEDRVKATGADSNLTTPEQRAERINGAIFGQEREGEEPTSLTGYIKQLKQSIFNEAKNTVGDNKIDTSTIDKGMEEPAFQATVQLRGHEGLVSGAQKLIDLAKNVGFKDPVTGEMLPAGSISAMQAVTKSLNANWTRDTASTIRDINGFINSDIAKSGGQGLYELGNKIHSVEKGITDAPGMSSIFGDMDKNGIKEGVPLDKLESKLNTMPLDQWQHIDRTLADLSNGRIAGMPEGLPPVPEEVKQSALAARSEMHGALAREVQKAGATKAGSFNQNSVNKTLNGLVGRKITSTFPPEEVENFHKLNIASQIMPGEHSYEGAALQGQRLASQPGFIEKYSPGAAAFVGHAVHPGIGGLMAGGAANAVAKQVAKARIAGDAQKLEQTLKNNANGGMQLRDLIKQEPK